MKTRWQVRDGSRRTSLKCSCCSTKTIILEILVAFYPLDLNLVTCTVGTWAVKSLRICAEFRDARSVFPLCLCAPTREDRSVSCSALHYRKGVLCFVNMHNLSARGSITSQQKEQHQKGRELFQELSKTRLYEALNSAPVRECKLLSGTASGSCILKVHRFCTSAVRRTTGEGRTRHTAAAES